MLQTNRRRFLGAIAGALTVPHLIRAVEPSASRVWVSHAAPAEGVPRLLDSVPEALRLLVPGARVVVKPNISWPNPAAWATTTCPEVLTAVVRYCLDRGAGSVVVLDNPLGESTRCVERTGAALALKDLPNTRLVTLARPRDFVPFTLPEGSQLAQVERARELLPATCIINVPKAKAHSATAVSFGAKNLMGLVQDRQAFHREADIHGAIAELFHVVKPHITVLDATTALTSRGPQGPGSIARPGIVAAAEDPVALDAYACTLARWDGRAVEGIDVPHIARAASLGFGSLRWEAISV